MGVQMDSFNLDNINHDIEHNLLPLSYASVIAKFASVVDSCKLENFPIKINLYITPDRIHYSSVTLHIHSVVKDRDRGTNLDVGQTHILYVDELERMSESTLTRTVFRAVEELVCHELAECFVVNGQRVFDPHKENEFGKAI